LAEVLNSDGRFCATDKLILAYLAGTDALVAVYWNRLPEAPELLALFPSCHGELTINAWWSSRQISKQLSRVYLAYTLCIIFATVYFRYHYTVDFVAGTLLAAVLIAAGPMMYRKLSGRVDSIGA
jgi:membrane-associated phospholipid phosphatase